MSTRSTPAAEAQRSGRLAIVPAAAVFDLRLSHADIRILAALSAYADKSGRCWPSVPTLAQRTNLSERHVRTSLRNLERSAYLVTEKRPGQSSMYRIPRKYIAGAPRNSAAGVEPDPGSILPEPRHCGSGDPGTVVPPNDIKNDTNNDKYAFVGNVIRLTRGDFDKWATAYSHIDLRAELQALDDFYDRELTGAARKKWFQRCSQALNNKNRKARAERQAAAGGPAYDPDVIH